MRIKIIFPIFQIQSMDILFIIKENFHLATHQYLRLRALHETSIYILRNTMCMLPKHRGFHLSAGLHLAK